MLPFDAQAQVLARWLEADSRHRRQRVLFAAVFLVAAILAFRFSLGPRTVTPITLFLVVPLALLGMEFGALGGAVGAVLSMIAYSVWSVLAGAETTWLDHVLRIIGFTISGYLVGLVADAGRIINSRAGVDFLTGLSNRARLTPAMERHAMEVERYGPHGAVLLLDLDGFKDVNDTHGHHIGDLLLQQVAQRLRRRVRETDLLCRLGGDEFAVLLKRAGVGEASAAAADIVRILSDEPYRVDDLPEPLKISASVGVAPFVAKETAAQTLVRADVLTPGLVLGSAACPSAFDVHRSTCDCSRTPSTPRPTTSPATATPWPT